MRQPVAIPTPRGKLGILMMGLGAVATTTIAGLAWWDVWKKRGESGRGLKSTRGETR